MGTAQISPAAYWIIDSAIVHFYPLSLLLDRNLELHYNRKGHGLGRKELTSVLVGLFEDGYLRAHVGLKSSKVKFPSREEIISGLNGTVDMYYGLTSAGGELWEALSYPRWGDFLDGEWGEGNGIIWAGSIELAMLRLSLVSGYRVGSDNLRVCEPWEATYWKTLPKGYEISYRTENYEDEDTGLTYPGMSSELHEQVRSIFMTRGNWYSNPFGAGGIQKAEID